MWPFKKKQKVVQVDVSKAIEKSFEEIKKKALVEANSLKLRIESLEAALAAKQDIINKQKKQIREQTEADIFLQCEKIKTEILDGAKKNDFHTEYLHLVDLQKQRASMQAAQSDSLNAWGGLGQAHSYPWYYLATYREILNCRKAGPVCN